jgi:hypothetical protein
MPALLTVWGYCKLKQLRGAGNLAGRKSVACPKEPRHVAPWWNQAAVYRRVAAWKLNGDDDEAE